MKEEAEVKMETVSAVEDVWPKQDMALQQESLFEICRSMEWQLVTALFARQEDGPWYHNPTI